LGASTGAATSSGVETPRTDAQAGITDLPVCGRRASSKKSSATGSTSKAQRRSSGAHKTARRAGKRRAARRKGAALRRERVKRAHGRALGARTNAAKLSRQEPIRATLTLDQEDQETVTGAAFNRSTDPQPLTLVYRVAGCRVKDDLPLPRSPLPTGPVKTAGARPLPLGSVQIDDVDADGDRYVVHLLVFVSSDKASEQGGTPQPEATTQPRASATPAQTATTGPTRPDSTQASLRTSPPREFSVDPGSYTSFVRLKAPWLRTVATPVTVTRSEDTEWIPIGIGIAGGLSGFFLFWLLRKIHGQDLLVKETWVLWLTAGVCVAVGAGTGFFTNYINQDIWTFNANGLALFTAAFSASTAGVTAGLLTGIYKTTATANVTAPPGGGGGAAPAGGGGAMGGQ
jgi:putative flippase GtrA